MHHYPICPRDNVTFVLPLNIDKCDKYLIWSILERHLRLVKVEFHPVKLAALAITLNWKRTIVLTVEYYIEVSLYSIY